MFQRTLRFLRRIPVLPIIATSMITYTHALTKVAFDDRSLFEHQEIQAAK